MKVIMKPQIFQAEPVFSLASLLTHGNQLKGKILKNRLETNFKIHVQESILNLPTGKLIICDPFVGDDTPPFDEALSPGKYTMAISYLMPLSPKNKSKKSGKTLKIEELKKVAAATLWFKKINPENLSWKLATAGNRKDFPVDSATVCFIDQSALQPLFEIQNVHNRMPVYEKVWKSDDGHLILNEKTQANIVAFPSGSGDGSYFALYGIDWRSGQLACITVDFGVVMTFEGFQGEGMKRCTGFDY